MGNQRSIIVRIGIIPDSSAALITALIRLRITLWLLAVMPIVFPRRASSQIMWAPAKVLPAPGGP
jgi:hypothetical protein